MEESSPLSDSSGQERGKIDAFIPQKWSLRQRVKKRLFFWTACFGLVLVFLNVLSGIMTSPLAYALPVPATIQLKGAPSTPNTSSATAGSQSLTHLPHPAAPGSAKAGPPQTIDHNIKMPMQAGSIDLQAGKAVSFTGSDKRLELDIPSGAITAQDLKAAGGKISLKITQIAPGSGSNAGGSGEFTLGTYLVQLVDAHGKLLTHGLRKALTARYHIQKGEKGLALNHAYLLLNGTLPAGATQIQGVVQPAANTSITSTMGKRQVQATTVDPKAQTLAASPAIQTPTSSLSFGDDSPIASFGKPDPASVGLSSGSLSYSEPINLPPGPGGLTPPLSLTYSSEAVNEQHNPSAAAGWAGEGWNLSFGSINWSESNVLAGCAYNACQSAGVTEEWESVWNMSDPYGTSSQLIPPDIDVASYYDKTGNVYCGASSPSYNCPVLWHTATESHDKIYMYVGSLSLSGQSVTPPCWRVWLPNGTMEEFGCTLDSLQYSYTLGGIAEVSGWNLDLITDPQGNQIHITYQQDMENWTDPLTGNSFSYPRDTELKSIQYDSPGCHSAQAMCTGSSWAPQMQVVFNASNTPSILTGTAPSGCNTGSHLRCDDPVDLSSSQGAAAPLVQSTYVLNSVQVQVRTSGSGSWNTLNTYQLGYEQSGPSTITDPASGQQRSVAGMLDLTSFQTLGGPGNTALMYSGMDASSSTSSYAYAYLKVFDLSGENLVVGPNTTLSYWIFPQDNASSSYIPVGDTNSTCVAVDLIFTNSNTPLRNMPAVDQNGNRLHPAKQCGHLTLDHWNYVTSDIGAVASGLTINRLDVGFDSGSSGIPSGPYRGYIDDVSIANPGAPAPLFTSRLESGDQQPTWIDTVDTTAPGGNLYQVGGICCGGNGPEAATRHELMHADNVAQPPVTFTYTNEVNTYVDSYFKPASTAGCGPTWNTGNGSGCLLWQANSVISNGVVQGTPTSDNQFLNVIHNGQGLGETFTYAIAHNNSHGVPGGGAANANPLACDSNQSGYPCNEADDSGWSRAVLTQESDTTVRLTQSGQGGTQTSTPVTETTKYSYQINAAQGESGGQECSDCLAGMYWGNQNDDDYLGFYNGVFMGFAQAKVDEPDGSIDVHDYYSGEGWGIYDTTGQVTCATVNPPIIDNPCHADPWWALANAAHGDEYETLYYDTDGTTPLKQVNTTYTAICPPSGVSGTPAYSKWGNWDGHLVSELDHNNPVAVCEIEQTQQTTQTFDGASNPVTTTTKWTYDGYGRVTQETTTTNGGTPTEVVQNTHYVWNDDIIATKTSATGTYIVDKADWSDVEDGSGNALQCSYLSYDGQSHAWGQSSSLTVGLVTSSTGYSDCGTSANNYTTSGPSTTTTKYDAYGNAIGTDDADANASVSGHTGCTASGTQYTSCTTIDSSFDVFPTAAANALNQTSSTSYSSTSELYGYGTWPVSTTDANNQTTSYTYDALGRMTSITLPGETSGDKTKQWVYTNWCSGTHSQAPCEEIDEIDRLDSGTTTTTRAFYDGEGRLVETRTPGPAGQSQDIVTYVYYDSAGRQIFKSNPYFVTAYTGAPGVAAYSIPDTTQPGTSTTYTNLRTTSVTDPNSHTTTTTNSVICSVPGTSDTGCYVQTMVVDANGHEHATLVGGMGKTNYTQTYNGTSGSYTLYSTTSATYDAAGNQLTTVSPDGSKITMVYDDLGRVTSETDPDRGTTTLTYDPNGNVIESVDARGSAGTVYTGYDGLNRPLWQNSTNSATGAWVSYTYDSTANGNDGIGHLTSESFTGSGGLTGSYGYTYDNRGQQTAETITVNGTNYSLAATYNDNGQAISQTYPTGEVVTPGYDNDGWLTSLNTKSGSTNTTIASNLAYSGLAGAAGQITTMGFGNGDVYTASFDSGMRLTSASLTQTSTGELVYQTQPAYDAVNNVVSVSTNISGATDEQQFCYDSLNRLVWGGTSGIPPCSSTSFNAGTLSAQYHEGYTYNAEGQLTAGLYGTATFGDSSHPHAVTSETDGYSATYDASGNETCRALTTATTCSGVQTGQQLSYDPEGRLTNWQNKPTSPTSTASYLYDGSGNRVAMLTTVNGTQTLTTYIGSIEEVQTSGSTTTTTTYYAVGGKRVAAKVNGTFYYFGYDALGSQVAVFNNSGNLIGSQLYGPYGSQRYSNGTLPTTIGFTGQQNDSVTGLDYYNARYYDPAVGQFLSADTVQGNKAGMDPYAYVGGNPESRTDPTGQRACISMNKCAPTTPGGSECYSSCSGSGGGSKDPCAGNPTAPGCKDHRDPCTVAPDSRGCPGYKAPQPKKPWCVIVCHGVKDWWQLGMGFMETAGSAYGLWVLITAFLGAEATTDGAATFLANFVRTWGAGLIHGIVDGLQRMMDSFTEHDPILDIALDLLKIGLDIAGIANLKSGFDAIQQVNDAMSGLQMARLFNAVGSILSGKPVTIAKYVSPAVSTILGRVTAIGVGTSLAIDFFQLGDDTFGPNGLLSYASDHSFSAGWNWNWN